MVAWNGCAVPRRSISESAGSVDRRGLALEQASDFRRMRCHSAAQIEDRHLRVERIELRTDGAALRKRRAWRRLHHARDRVVQGREHRPHRLRKCVRITGPAYFGQHVDECLIPIARRQSHARVRELGTEPHAAEHGKPSALRRRLTVGGRGACTGNGDQNGSSNGPAHVEPPKRFLSPARQSLRGQRRQSRICRAGLCRTRWLGRSLGPLAAVGLLTSGPYLTHISYY